MRAAQCGHGSVILMLVAWGVSASELDETGSVLFPGLFIKKLCSLNVFSWTAFHYAAYNDAPDLLKLLSAAGVNENALNIDGSTALIVAIDNKKVDSVRALLELNVDTSKATTKRDTPAEIVALINAHKRRSVSCI